MMKTGSKELLAVGLFCASIVVHGQSVTSLTASEVTARDCIAGASGCDSISKIIGYSTGAGLTTSSANLLGASLPTEFTGVTATAGASIAGSTPNTLVTPTLTATATSNAGTREGATAYALQSYTYTGTTSTTDTFGGSVAYSQNINGSYPLATTGGGTTIGIEAFTLARGALFNAGAAAQDDYDALADAFAGNTSVDSGIVQTGFTLLGSNSASDSQTNLAGSLSSGVTVTLNPGETVWVIAEVGAFAPNGSTVDPTFTTQWTKSANLVAGVVSAPEIDAASAATDLSLLLGSLLVLRARRSVKVESVARDRVRNGFI